MSMIIPTGAISTAGIRLADVAEKMGSLARRADSLNSAVRSCYQGAGVGNSVGSVATVMHDATALTKSKSTALATAATIYETAETELVTHAQAVGRNIENGYNYAWAAKPDINAILNVAPVVVEPRYQLKDPPKPTWKERLKSTVKGYAGAVKTAVGNIKASYANHGVLYDVVQYGKAALKVGKGIVKIVGAVGTIGAAVAAAAGTGGLALPAVVGAVAVGMTEILSAGNDILNGIYDAAYVYADQYEMVGTTNVLKDYLTDKGRELGTMLGSPEIGEAIGKAAYTGLDIVSFADGMESVGKSFGLFNTAATGTTGYSKVWGETSFDDLMDHEIKSTSASGIVRNILGWAPSSEMNLLYEAGEKSVKAVKKGNKMVESIEDVFNTDGT